MIRTQNTAIAAIMLRRGEADAMICGTEGRFSNHLQHVRDIIGKAEGVFDFSALSALILPRGTCFLCDTHITPDPTADEIAEMAVLSVHEVRRFGIEPRVALLSHSNFGSHHDASADKMRAAHAMLRARMPDLMMDGEMHADSALSDEIRKHSLPESVLIGEANLLIMPNLDAAHITCGALSVLGGGVTIGPILIGAAKPVHVVTSSVTTRGLVNMSALAVVDAAAASSSIPG